MEHHRSPRRRPRHGPAESPRRTVSGHARRLDGQIPVLVLAHMRTHPQLDFSPYELGKALCVSHGTIRRHLLRLAEAGQVRRTKLIPARFQITT